MKNQTNVLGTSLQSCGTQPETGYLRDGFCAGCAGDEGQHTVCAAVTTEFLEFSLSRGNDLMTPRPEYGFPGLVAGNRWCLCVSRWVEAYKAGCAPPVHLVATHISVIEYVDMETLREFAADAGE